MIHEFFVLKDHDMFRVIKFFLIPSVLLVLANTLSAASPELLSVEKIWNQGEHNAFTDIVEYKGKLFCTFRESNSHVGADGAIRVIVSENGKNWKSTTYLTEKDVDLRDPKLSIMPDGRLMLLMGGSVYKGQKKLITRQPRVCFSEDGTNWTDLKIIMEPGDWLWRVTWHKGVGYGVSRIQAPTTKKDRSHEKIASLYKTTDGIQYEKICQLDVTGNPNETTVRFVENDEMIALIRREAADQVAWIGRSFPPYTDWKYHPTDYRIGGPNFVQLPNGELWAGGRYYIKKAQTALYKMRDNNLKVAALLPSGGDTSYPGFLWRDNQLWMTYYASHEGKTSIYLAKFKFND